MLVRRSVLTRREVKCDKTERAREKERRQKREREREREKEGEREREYASERRKQKGGQGRLREAGIATEGPLRNEQPVERASVSCWLMLPLTMKSLGCIADEPKRDIKATITR